MQIRTQMPQLARKLKPIQPGPSQPSQAMGDRIDCGLTRAVEDGKMAFLAAAGAGALTGVVLSVARDTMEGPGLTMLAAMGLSPTLAIPVAAALGAVAGLATRDRNPDPKLSLLVGGGAGIVIAGALTGCWG